MTGYREEVVLGGGVPIAASAVKLEVVNELIELMRKVEHYTASACQFDDSKCRLAKDAERKPFDPAVSDDSVGDTHGVGDGFGLEPGSIRWGAYLRLYTWGLRRYVLDEASEAPEEWIDLVPEKREYTGALQALRYGSAFTFMGDLRWALSKETMGAESPDRQDAMEEAIIEDPLVQSAMEEARASGGKKVEAQCRAIISSMRADLKPRVVQSMAYGFRKLYRMIYDSIHLDTEGFEQVARLLSQAESLCHISPPRPLSGDTGPRGGLRSLHEPVVLMPMHRSYVDFLVLSYMLFAQDLPVPHIAANQDSFGMPGVNLLLKKAGAFYLKKKFQGDVLYTAVFNAYVQHLVESCPALEFFIEATRSRTGKFISPRTGLLSIVVRSFYEGRVNDVHFAPVALNYEKVLEVDTFPLDMLGEAKESKSLATVFSSINSLGQRNSFGRVDIRFAEPLSLKAFTEDFIREENRSEYHGDSYVEPNEAEMKVLRDSLVERFLSGEDFRLVEALAARILRGMIGESMAMPTAVLSSVILKARLVGPHLRSGLTFDEIVEEVTWLAGLLKARGARVGMQGETRYSIEAEVTRALSLLDTSIIPAKDGDTSSQAGGTLGGASTRGPVLYGISTQSGLSPYLLLHYYENTLLHVLYTEAVLATAWGCQAGRNKGTGVPVGELAHSFNLLSGILEREDTGIFSTRTYIHTARCMSPISITPI